MELCSGKIKISIDKNKHKMHGATNVWAGPVHQGVKREKFY